MKVNKHPLVSVVIPTFNHAHFLGRALQSVLNQTYNNWEVIIVDNYSQDNTDEVVQRFVDPRITLLKINNHGVIAASRNMGIRAANGELIAFLDSDDWWKPKKLEESIYQFDADTVVVYHDLYLVLSEQKKWYWRKLRSRNLYSPVFDDLIENGNALPNSSVVVRKSFLERIGGLSEEKALIAWEDYDCWLRLAKHSDRYVRLAHTLGYYWAGGGNISATSAERTIKNLSVFQYRYLQGRSEVLPAWFHYGYGRACYKLGRYRDAVTHLWKAFFLHKSMMIKLRSTVTLAAIYLFPNHK